MGVGTSRLAYRARVRDGCCYGYTEGSYCIFKVFKPDGHWDQVASVSGVDVSPFVTFAVSGSAVQLTGRQVPWQEHLEDFQGRICCTPHTALVRQA